MFGCPSSEKSQHESSGFKSGGVLGKSRLRPFLQYSTWGAVLLITVIRGIGASQAFHQWLNALVGWAILHSARPHDAAYDVSVVAVMRQGAVGGAVLYYGVLAAALIIGIALPLLCCCCCMCLAGDFDWETSGKAPSSKAPAEKSPTSFFLQLLNKLLSSLARAAVAAVIGAAIMRHANLAPLDLTHAARAHVVGAAVLFIPRTVVAISAQIWAVIVLEIPDTDSEDGDLKGGSRA